MPQLAPPPHPHTLTPRPLRDSDSQALNLPCFMKTWPTWSPACSERSAQRPPSFACSPATPKSFPIDSWYSDGPQSHMTYSPHQHRPEIKRSTLCQPSHCSEDSTHACHKQILRPSACQAHRCWAPWCPSFLLVLILTEPLV